MLIRPLYRDLNSSSFSKFNCRGVLLRVCWEGTRDHAYKNPPWWLYVNYKYLCLFYNINNSFATIIIHESSQSLLFPPAQTPLISSLQD